VVTADWRSHYCFALLFVDLVQVRLAVQVRQVVLERQVALVPAQKLLVPGQVLEVVRQYWAEQLYFQK
jgi:hypothetical protein